LNISRKKISRENMEFTVTLMYLVFFKRGSDENIIKMMRFIEKRWFE
jgi:hypothetical protein